MASSPEIDQLQMQVQVLSDQVSTLAQRLSGLEAGAAAADISRGATDQYIVNRMNNDDAADASTFAVMSSKIAHLEARLAGAGIA
jgi:phage shock protein A